MFPKKAPIFQQQTVLNIMGLNKVRNSQCHSKICSFASSLIAALMSPTDMQTGTSTTLLIVCMIMLIPVIC